MADAEAEAALLADGAEGAPEEAAEDVDSDASSDDGVQVVLMQPDDEDGGEGEEYGEDGAEYAEGEEAAEALVPDEDAEAPTPAAAEGGDGDGEAATPGEAVAATRTSSAGGAASSTAAASTRNRKWVAPHLAGKAAAAAGTKPSAAKPGLTPAQRAKFGPLVHVPGGMQMSFEPPLPENIDIDQLPDKPWRKPEVDMTDYFNYGFNEDTWR